MPEQYEKNTRKHRQKIQIKTYPRKASFSILSNSRKWGNHFVYGAGIFELCQKENCGIIPIQIELFDPQWIVGGSYRAHNKFEGDFPSYLWGTFVWHHRMLKSEVGKW